MKETIRLLIVDDHPMIVLGYELSLKEMAPTSFLKIDKAYSVEDTLRLLKKNTKLPYHIVLLDINLPASKDYKIIAGDDLGLKIMKMQPSTKIIVSTMLDDMLRIAGIIENLKPHGFLIKSNTTPESLYDAILTVLQDKIYYSREARIIMDNSELDENQLDHLDRRILYFLSLGEKTKNLPEYIPLSMPSIERRKKKMKTFLEVTDGGDRQLIQKAKKRGFI